MRSPRRYKLIAEFVLKDPSLYVSVRAELSEYLKGLEQKGFAMVDYIAIEHYVIEKEPKQ